MCCLLFRDSKKQGKVEIQKEDAKPKTKFIQFLESEDKMELTDEKESKDQKQEQQQPQSKDEKKEDTKEDKKEDKKITHSEILEDLDKNVTVWSDFLKIYYHPKSIRIVNQFTHGVDDFDVYPLGDFMRNQVNMSY